MSKHQLITRDNIHAHIKAGNTIQLVEALPEKYYRDAHLPGAINLPHDQVRELAGDLLPSKDDFIVVYCANTPCRNSNIAAQTLESMGYTNVAEYVEGKQDWIDAGFPVESDKVAA